MSEKDPNREQTPGRPEIPPEENQNKSGVDKLIDKAQEKGVFDKAARMLQDKFRGGKRR